MLVRSLALGAVASLGLAAAAQAEGWGGWYLGLHAGMGSSETDATRTITNNTYFAAANLTAVENASRMSLEEETFTGGGSLGVNWPFGEHFLIGAEIDASGFGNDTSGAATAIAYPASAGTFSVTNSLEQTWLATARLRVGITTSWFMAYATGGYAGADMRFTQTFSDTFGLGIPLQTIENSEFRSGYSMGGGVEVLIESGASIRVEYMHYDLGDIAANGPIATGTTTSNGLAEVSNDVWRIGMNVQMD